MNCDEARILIHGHSDGELETTQEREIEMHIQSCPNCARVLQNISNQREAIVEGATYFKASPVLKRRIQAALPRQQQVPVPLLEIGRPWRSAVQAFVAIVCVLALTWSVVKLETISTETDRIGEEVVASHVRSLMATHLTDVASTDQHTVKPWFNGKVDFSPSVVDLASEGFPLIGGRLDYIDRRPVAVLIYQRRQHFINLFIWPVDGKADQAPAARTYRGYHVVHWTQSAFDFWAVSDLNQKELEDLTQLLWAPKKH